MGATTVLSPHPDDAVLAVWHVLAGEGDVRVVNTFTGAPAGHPPGAWDRLTGADDAVRRAAERTAEDRRALALVGRAACNLGFLDAEYRNGHRPLEALIDELEAIAQGSDVVLVPAALGTHPDHRLARDAGLELWRRGENVALYADVPHATSFGWPEAITGRPPRTYVRPEVYWQRCMQGTGLSLEDLESRVAALHPDDRRLKRQAAECYRTQLPALEQVFSILSRPEVLGYEVIWPLPPA